MNTTIAAECKVRVWQSSYWPNLHDVWSTLSMLCMLLLGGSEGMPLKKYYFKICNYSLEIESKSRFDWKLWNRKAHNPLLATPSCHPSLDQPMCLQLFFRILASSWSKATVRRFLAFKFGLATAIAIIYVWFSFIYIVAY